MITGVIPSPADWYTNNGVTNIKTLPGHTRTDDSDGQNAPANVTTVLTVTNVNISNNGAAYVCVQGLIADSDIAYLTVLGELTFYSSI